MTNSLFPTAAQSEVYGRNSANRPKQIVGDTAGLQQIDIARWQQPHPKPGGTPGHAQASQKTESARGQQKEANDIDEELATVRSGKKEQRSCDPFDTATTRVQTEKIRVNPMPLFFGQPVQNPRRTIRKRVVVRRRVEYAAQRGKYCQEQKRQRKWPPKSDLQPVPGRQRKARSGFHTPDDQCAECQQPDQCITHSMQRVQTGQGPTRAVAQCAEHDPHGCRRNPRMINLCVAVLWFRFPEGGHDLSLGFLTQDISANARHSSCLITARSIINALPQPECGVAYADYILRHVGSKRRNAKPSAAFREKSGEGFWCIKLTRLSLRKLSRIPHNSPNFIGSQASFHGTGTSRNFLPWTAAMASRISRNVRACSCAAVSGVAMEGTSPSAYRWMNAQRSS